MVEYLVRMSWWLLVPGALALLGALITDGISLVVAVLAMFLVGWARAYLVAGRKGSTSLGLLALPIAFGAGIFAFMFPILLMLWTADVRTVEVHSRGDGGSCQGVVVETGEPFSLPNNCAGTVGSQTPYWMDGVLQGRPQHVTGLDAAANGSFVVWLLGFPFKAATIHLDRRDRARSQSRTPAPPA